MSKKKGDHYVRTLWKVYPQYSQQNLGVFMQNPMTAAQLILKLSSFPPDEPVLISSDNGVHFIDLVATTKDFDADNSYSISTLFGPKCPLILMTDEVVRPF